MPRVLFDTAEEMAAFSAAVGFGEDFFGSGQLYKLVEQYKTERGLTPETTEVEVWLRDGEHFLVEAVRVAARYLVFYTEFDEHICVPHAEVAKVRIARRAKATSRGQPGFTIELLDESES
jgi:hypothetical protein